VSDTVVVGVIDPLSDRKRRPEFLGGVHPAGTLAEVAAVHVLRGNPRQGLASVIDEAGDAVVTIESSPLQ